MCEDNEIGKKMLLFYCFIVFYLDGCFILLGNLVKVYSLDGELKLFFLGSKCYFNVCYFLCNKIRMLIDCLENVY